MTSPPLDAPTGPRLAERRILLGVCGSVAAYKAVVFARLLVKEGAAVRVILTRSAAEFVGPATFSALTGQPVLTAMFDPARGGELHVELAAWAEQIVILPATADFLARMATGRADDLLAATVLCSAEPVLVAPAMHPRMWSHPATQRSLQQLERDGLVEVAGPVAGEVASGEVGVGRMEEPEAVLARILAKLADRSLAGFHIVVTAGPTVEDLDPVRFISNRSSGKMGFAIARDAAARGARVTLIAGPVALETPPTVQRIDVRSALEMKDALWKAMGTNLAGADALVMAAAVGDYRPAAPAHGKLKRSGPMSLELEPNPDLLAEIGAARNGPKPLLVGFAVETGTDEQILDYARGKLAKKRVDVVAANAAAESMGRDDNRILLVTHNEVRPLGHLSKMETARKLVDFVAGRLEEH